MEIASGKVGSLLGQNFDDRHMPFLGRIQERRVTCLVGRVDVGLVFEQQPDHCRIPLAGGGVQGRSA